MENILIVGEPWREILAKGNLNTIVISVIPEDVTQMASLIRYLDSKYYEDNQMQFFVRYIDFATELGIVKKVDGELKDLGSDDENINVADGEFLVEFETDGITYLCACHEDDHDDFYTSIRHLISKNNLYDYD